MNFSAQVSLSFWAHLRWFSWAQQQSLRVSRWSSPALAHGLILVGIIFVYGDISGAHVNPAITAAVLITGKIKIERAVYYWVAQMLGGIVAAVVVNIVIPHGARLGQTTGSLTANAVWTAALFEAVMTFFLASAVLQAAVFGRAGNLAALAIGLTLAGSILAGGIYTGAALNPARTVRSGAGRG